MFVWADATVSWPNRTGPGGSRGLDDYFTGTSHNIGAEIMGRNKSYPQRRPWRDHDWLGWRATNLRSTSSKEIWPRRSTMHETRRRAEVLPGADLVDTLRVAVSEK